MNRRHFLSRFTYIGGAVILAGPSTALAHRTKLSYTTLTWSKPSGSGQLGSLGIEHELHQHDAAIAMARLGKITQPDLVSLKARAQVALYVQTKFKIKTLDNQDIALETLGAETDGKHVIVFQEAKLDALPEGVLIDCQILRDVFSGQVNHVNYGYGQDTKSIVFSGREKAKKLIL